RRVPPDVRADAALDVLIAREPGLPLRRDGVDVVGGGQRRDAHLPFPRPLQQPEHHVPRTFGAAGVDHLVQGLDPFGGLLRVDVRQLAGQAVADDRAAYRAGVWFG